jgi:quinol monooxygenase YgiN
VDGRLLYLVFEGTEDPNSIWITQLWTSKEAHDRSLVYENVKKTITNIDRDKMLQARLKPLFGVGMPE